MSRRGAALGAALAALAGYLGLFSSGAPKRKKKPEATCHQPCPGGRYSCACVSHPSADGTMAGGNCGLRVGIGGAVRIREGHVPPAGYDHEAIT